jgi:uncharacterized membrane protein YcaP (DUF421 family)
MDAVLRAAVIYAFLLLIFRITGKRSLAQITTFDFILLLVIGEATQQALLGQDFSVTNAFLVILTLVGIDIGLSLLKQRSPWLEKIIEDIPLILVVDGKPFQDRLDRARVGADDILCEARRQRGLERMDQIKYAILERSGGITVIAKHPANA